MACLHGAAQQGAEPVFFCRVWMWQVLLLLLLLLLLSQHLVGPTTRH